MVNLKSFSKICIYLIFFLVPLFFLPVTSNVLDFQKQFLLILLVSMSFLSWLGNILIEKKFEFNFHFLNYFVVGFFAFLLISSLFSLYSYGSLWGSPLNISDSFLTILGFTSLYFLVVNIFKKEEIFNLFFTLAASGFFVALYGLFQIFNIYIFPFDFAKTNSFNTIGTINGLGLYLAVIFALIFPLTFVGKKLIRSLLVFFGATIFIALLVINFLTAWIILAVGSLLAFIFNFIHKENSDDNFSKILPLIILFVCLIFISFDIFAKDLIGVIYNLLPQTPAEVSLTHGTTFNIAVDTLKQSPKNLFLGSGPGTFIYDYSKFKPIEINKTVFWNSRFSNGASEILGKLATIGILGTLIYLLLMIFVLLKAFRLISESGDDSEIPLAFFSGWLAIAVAQFLYPFNLALVFLFWALTACIITWDDEKVDVITLESGSKIAYAALTIFVLILAFQIGMLIWVGKRYYAEVNYLGALQALQGNDTTNSIQKLGMAINSTGWHQDNYLRDLAQVYLIRIQEEIRKGGDPNETLKTIAPLLGSAVDVAKRNTDQVNGNDVANWAVRGYIYRQLTGFVNDAENWAITCYKKATELEPTNSYLYTELALANLSKNDTAAAKDNLQKAVNLNEQYSNARYYLGLIYDSEGNKEAAIQQFQVIVQFNPDNADIKKILENLTAGKPALDQLVQTQPSVQENPEGQKDQGILNEEGAQNNQPVNVEGDNSEKNESENNKSSDAKEKKSTVPEK